MRLSCVHNLRWMFNHRSAKQSVTFGSNSFVFRARDVLVLVAALVFSLLLLSRVHLRAPSDRSIRFEACDETPVCFSRHCTNY